MSERITDEGVQWMVVRLRALEEVARAAEVVLASLPSADTDERVWSPDGARRGVLRAAIAAAKETR